MKSTPATELVSYLRESVLNVDSIWSVERPGGFSWWPHNQRQDIFIDRQRTEKDGAMLSRLVVSTEIGRIGKPTDTESELVSSLAGLATLSGIVCEKQSLRLHSHAWIEQSNLPLYKIVLGLVAGLQIHEAAVFSNALEQSGLATPAATPHPINGFRHEPDEIASIVETVIAPIGQRETPWPDEMFKELRAQYLDGPPCLLASADENGICAEFPFGAESSLLQANNNQTHPIIGKGLWVLNSFGLEEIPEGSPINPLAMNSWEIENADQPFFGSWCAAKDGRLDFVTFVPNAISQLAAAKTFFLSGIGRARRMSIKWLGDDWSNTWDGEGNCKSKTAMERVATAKKNRNHRVPGQVAESRIASRCNPFFSTSRYPFKLANARSNNAETGSVT
jgi:hypothetical protein